MNTPTISTRKILIFWFPLLLTWLMMAIEGPYIAAIIARLPQVKYNLAAFGVSFSFALVIEAPVIMLMSATIALTKGPKSFLKLRSFTMYLNAAIVAVNLIFLIPFVFDWITLDLIGLDTEIAERVYMTSAMMIPWSPAIGYRRFYQGLLIKYHQTRKVTFGTIFRLTTMGVSAWLLAKHTDLQGSVIGGIALSSGVMAEAVATRILVGSTRRLLLAETQEKPTGDHLDYRSILVFYTPLALMSIISLGVRPAMVFFLGKSRMSLDTLAVLPVINSLLFIFAAIGLSLQEVVVALMGDQQENRKKIESFVLYVAILVAFTFGIITFSPLAWVWFQSISGLSNEMTQFALVPARILLFMPLLSVFLSYQRGLMVNLKTTYYVSTASVIEVTGIILGLILTINVLDLIGAIAASISVTLGRVASVSYLLSKRKTTPRFSP